MYEVRAMNIARCPKLHNTKGIIMPLGMQRIPKNSQEGGHQHHDRIVSNANTGAQSHCAGGG